MWRAGWQTNVQVCSRACAPKLAAWEAGATPLPACCAAPGRAPHPALGPWGSTMAGGARCPGPILASYIIRIKRAAARAGLGTVAHSAHLLLIAPRAEPRCPPHKPYQCMLIPTRHMQNIEYASKRGLSPSLVARAHLTLCAESCPASSATTATKTSTLMLPVRLVLIPSTKDMPALRSHAQQGESDGGGWWPACAHINSGRGRARPGDTPELTQAPIIIRQKIIAAPKGPFGVHPEDPRTVGPGDRLGWRAKRRRIPLTSTQHGKPHNNAQQAPSRAPQQYESRPRGPQPRNVSPACARHKLRSQHSPRGKAPGGPRL